MFDYIIIGAGLAGAVLAERIATQLDKKVLVIEKRNHIGGNCYDYKDDNSIIVHKYGPHLFHTNNESVVKYLSNFTDWHIYHHEVLAFIDGQKVPIPFNFNTLYALFPISKAKSLEQKLLANYPYNTRVPILELKKSRDEGIQSLANFIYEKIFRNYTTKQWGIIPEEIDEAVTARVPIFIGKDNRYFNDRYQMVPKNGYTEMISNMLYHKNIKIILNTDFKEVGALREREFYFFGVKFHGKVIYTGPIDELFDYCYGELPYKSIEMRFESHECYYFQEKATINYPNDYDFTRITEFKHIHPSFSHKTTILKEYPKTYDRKRDIPYYPVFTKENKERYNHYAKLAQSIKNLILVGRLAEYKYYDMDDVVERALEVFREEIS